VRNWHLDRVHNSMASLRRVSGNAAEKVKHHLKGAASRAKEAAATCKGNAKATTYLWKLSAGSVVAEYKATARVTRAACKAKAAPAAQVCKEKAASAAMVCSDLARVAGVSSYRSVRKNWDKASEWGKENWEKAGVVASRVRVRVDRHPVSPLLYITLLCVGIGAVAFNGMYTKAYVAYVNGEEVGVVSSEEELSSIVGNVETRVASVLGEEYSYDAEITLAPTYLDAGTQTNSRAVEDALFEDTGALMSAYAVSVDGQELGYAQTSEELQTMLDNVTEPYLNEQTVEHHFTQDVEIYEVEVPSNTEFTPDTLQSTLSGNKEEAEYVTVERGDTFNSIAEAAGLTGDELQALNPDADSSQLTVGDQLLVKQAVPMLTVETVVTDTYEETIQSPVEYVDNPNLYEGTTRLKAAGQDGVEKIEARITCINGQETQREEVSRTTVQEATTTYMYQGTK